MTPEELTATRKYVQSLLQQSLDRFLTIPEIHTIDLAREVERLRAELAAAKAEAWEEGYEEGEADGNSSSAPAGKNPYRTGA